MPDREKERERLVQECWQHDRYCLLSVEVILMECSETRELRSYILSWT